MLRVETVYQVLILLARPQLRLNSPALNLTPPSPSTSGAQASSSSLSSLAVRHLILSSLPPIGPRAHRRARPARPPAPLADTPWDEPTPNSPEFAAFLDGSYAAQEPWRRLGSARESGVAQLLLAMLTVDPERRPRLKDIERMDWYCQ